jgi:hypothetical protein
MAKNGKGGYFVKAELYEAQQIQRNHLCGYQGCRNELVIAWKDGAHHVYCNQHPLNDQFIPIEGVETYQPELEQRVEDLAAAQAKRKREAVTKGALSVEHQGVILADVKDAGTRQLATADQVTVLIEFALHYGLDLYRNHACLMYGKPFIEIDGLYYLARQTGEFIGLNTHPIFLDEKRQYGWDDTDIAWMATVHRKGCKEGFVGWHRVSQGQVGEMTKDGREYRYPVLRNWPDRMVEKQAIRFAMRAAFPDLPIWEVEE